MGCEYKDLFFCRNNGWIMGKHGQGTHCTKMGADRLAENTPNDKKIYLSKFSAQALKFGFSMKKGFIGRP